MSHVPNSPFVAVWNRTCKEPTGICWITPLILQRKSELRVALWFWKFGFLNVSALPGEVCSIYNLYLVQEGVAPTCNHHLQRSMAWISQCLSDLSIYIAILELDKNYSASPGYSMRMSERKNCAQFNSSSVSPLKRFVYGAKPKLSVGRILSPSEFWQRTSNTVRSSHFLSPACLINRSAVLTAPFARSVS